MNNTALPARVSLALLTSAGVVALYLVRVNFSVAIVAMVRTASPNTNYTTTTAPHTAFCSTLNQVNRSVSGEEAVDVKLESSGNSSQTNNTAQDFSDTMVLTGTERGLVLGGFFYGYCLTCILGGRLGELYGTKRVFGGAILIGGVLTLFTPLAARSHYVVLMLLRTVIGLSQGVVYPSMNTMVARWIPPLERSRFMAFTYMSNTLGTIITMPLCGMIIAEVGWPAVFYVTGGVSLVWVVVWALFMHDSPDQHPKISLEERSYILHAIQEGTTHNKPSRTPWWSFLSSAPLWATHAAHTGSMFGFNLLLTQLPIYMSSVLGFSIKTNGFLSALPFLSMFVGGNIAGQLSDWLVTHKYLTVCWSRKIFATISLVLPGAVLVIVGYVGCNTTLAVTLFTIGTAFSGAICSGHRVNHLDLAPNFAGTTSGMSNALAFGIVTIVPVVVGAMTSNQSLEEWQSVFWLTGVVYVVTSAVFVIFGSTDIQPWNFPQEDETQQPSEEETEFL
ncbi:putative inorganic phosphate cotransporter isoform X2 [Homarus americanus]|uniref:putative inorganic phosphate cotransporter isoform X2 n=1 Tax=Homarus americanus TaxID=6706 RepID=UPI001C452242|nr:putative inorganic phosphate cotransporter isoform X2 [Homarus americanus]